VDEIVSVEKFSAGFSAVDPFAQQRIVYAKCLTSHSTDDLRSGPEDTTAKDNGTSTNVMTGGNISDMFEAARIGDVSGLVCGISKRTSCC